VKIVIWLEILPAAEYNFDHTALREDELSVASDAVSLSVFRFCRQPYLITVDNVNSTLFRATQTIFITVSFMFDRGAT